MISGKRLFITGGLGFIASHVVEELMASNTIVLFDNGHRRSLADDTILSHPNVTVVEGDVLDTSGLNAAMEGAEIVIHCAAIAGIETVVKRPMVTMKVNLLGTINALDGAVVNGVKKFVDFSTSEVYGPQVYRAAEDAPTTQGPVGSIRWSYAVSKLAAEHMAHAYAAEHGLEAVSVRPFNVYGPRQSGESAIQRFAYQAVRNEPLTITGDGTQIRAWCFVSDFVDALLRVLSTSFPQMEVFNIGNPRGTITVLELANKIIALTGSKSKIEFRAQTGPDVEVRVPSIAKAERLLGFSPRVGLDDGITATVEYFQRTMKDAKA
jgi:UDP-glucose 4-epimerase